MATEKHDELTLEDKLYRTKYEPDSKNSHIELNQGNGADTEIRKLLKVCPAEVYKEDPADKEQINVSHDNCLECGTCRQIVKDTAVLNWKYPDGGMGVKYKHG